MDPRQYFEKRIKNNDSVLSRLKQVSFILSMSRLMVFLAMVLIIYIFWGNTAVVASTFALGFGSFLFMVSRYVDVRNKKDFHQRIKDINVLELKALDGDYSEFDAGSEFLNDDHPFNKDIDLFGSGSIFQRINRSGTGNGKRRLAEILNSNDTDEISEKQKAINELKESADWRQDYQVTASMIQKW